jgi:hypothetical protein
MAKAKMTRKTLLDFPEYRAAKENLERLGAEWNAARENMPQAAEALAGARAGVSTLARPESARTRAAVALVVGLPTGGAAPLSIADAESQVNTAMQAEEVLADAYKLQAKLCEDLARRYSGEVVESCSAQIRELQSQALTAYLEFARRIAEHRALLQELEAEGVAVGGVFGLLFTADPGDFGDVNSPIRNLLVLARERGVAVPDVPEIAAADKARRSYELERDRLNTEAAASRKQRAAALRPGMKTIRVSLSEMMAGEALE